MAPDADVDLRAAIPANIDSPDRIAWGLTARQIAILASAAGLAWLLWRATAGVLPLPVVGIALIPLFGVAGALALGRRDGLTLDAWVWAALRYRRAPRRTVATADTTGAVVDPVVLPDGRAAMGDGGPVPQPLRLPARSIGEVGDQVGVIGLEGGSSVLVAATTVNIGLRTSGEQAGMIAGYARWLNSLTGPVQVVVSAQRVDLTSHAQRVHAAADALPHPALADAADDYAAFLLEIAERRDPLWRTITIAHPAAGAHGAAAEAARRADHTAAALSALGSHTRVLDGPTTTAVLTAAADPYTPTDASWPRAVPGSPVTSPLEVTPPAQTASDTAQTDMRRTTLRRTTLRPTSTDDGAE